MGRDTGAYIDPYSHTSSAFRLAMGVSTPSALRLAFRAASVSSKILSQIRGVCFSPTLPIELQEAILITARHSVRRSGAFNEGDLRLVSRHFNEVHRKHFWKKKWLNLRLFNASWSSIGERIQAIASNDAIKNVKLEGTLTDITPLRSRKLVDSVPSLPESGGAEWKGSRSAGSTI